MELIPKTTTIMWYCSSPKLWPLTESYTPYSDGTFHHHTVKKRVFQRNTTVNHERNSPAPQVIKSIPTQYSTPVILSTPCSVKSCWTMTPAMAGGHVWTGKAQQINASWVAFYSGPVMVSSTRWLRDNWCGGRRIRGIFFFRKTLEIVSVLIIITVILSCRDPRGWTMPWRGSQAS